MTRYFVDHSTPVPTDGIVPAGYCVDDTTVSLVDEEGAPVAVNRVGEIVVKSRYVAPGYWRRPELTNARFQPDPLGSDARLYITGDLGMLRSDGCLLHLGRKDQQVKIRGVRIETIEIEQVLWASGWFKEVLVVTRPTQQGEQQLVAYLVPTATVAPTVTALRNILTASLPAAMIPTAFVMLDALPLNANQKVDRSALPAPGHSRPQLDQPYVAPRIPIEAQLTALWTEVLTIEPIGIHDHFLDLGGNSLKAMQIIARVLSSFQVNVPMHQLFATPTIADMALAIARYQAASMLATEALLTELENLPEAEAVQLLMPVAQG